MSVFTFRVIQEAPGARGFVSIPEEKQEEILNKCIEILKCKTVTKRKFQSLIGSLMYVHKYVRPTRFFTNRLLQALREASGTFIQLSPEIYKDITWFINFLPRFNGTATYVYDKVVNAHTITIDASLERVGGVWGKEVYSASVHHMTDRVQLGIVHLEMVNILIALHVWKDQWKCKNVTFYVDNLAVVQICNSGYTKDKWLATCIKNIWLLASVHDISISVRHIPGYRNTTADLLSRWTDSLNQNFKLSQLVPDARWKTVDPEWFTLNNEI